MLKTTRKRPSKRNPIAKRLEDPEYMPRRIPNKKTEDNRGSKNLLKDYEDGKLDNDI